MPDIRIENHDQLYKAIATQQFSPLLAMFFPEEAAQLDIAQARFVDKELFSAPPMGPGREVDLLAEVPLRSALTGPAKAEAKSGASTLVAIWIEVQAQRDPDFLARMIEYYGLLRRTLRLPVLPIALFPVVDVLGRARGQRPRLGYELVTQRDEVLGHVVEQFTLLAVTLPALDASAYLQRPEALAGALAARMRRASGTSVGRHKVTCLRCIMEGSEVEHEATRRLLLDAVEIALPLSGQDAEEFEGLLRRPENEGIRHTMKTWTETQQEIGRKIKAQQDILRVLAIRFGPVPTAVEERVRQIDDEATLDALLARAITAATLADIGLL